MKPLALLGLGLLVALVAGSAWAAELDATRRFEVHGPALQSIAVLDAPVISGGQYALSGRVAYEGVEGQGYLEMWSVFPDGSRYFSRTLDVQGPMARLSGSAAERAFTLPFFLGPETPHPVRLELNVVLPGAGHVAVSGLALRSGADTLHASGAWWSPQTAGWIGGVAGSAVGVFGALIGTLCSLGRGRRFVLAGLLALGVTGVLVLVVGGLALALGQPYEVWYPLVLMGGLDAVLGFTLLPTARRRFEATELRRMRALDAR